MTYRTHRTYRKPARTAARRTRSTVVVASVIAGVALIGLTTTPIDSLHGDLEPAVIGNDSSQLTTIAGRAPNQPTPEVRGQRDDHEPTVVIVTYDLPAMAAPGQRNDRDRHVMWAPPMALGEAHGVIPDGVMVSVFDGEIPAVANLDPDLLDAIREAAIDAADVGIEFFVNSGWRSPEYQEQLLTEAIAQYGSEEEAARWVATADTSEHV